MGAGWPVNIPSPIYGLFCRGSAPGLRHILRCECVLCSLPVLHPGHSDVFENGYMVSRLRGAIV
jgi:hypothetical protein